MTLNIRSVLSQQILIWSSPFNFAIDEERGIALVYIPFSKTNQFGQQTLVIPLVENSCKALDPIFHLKLLFSLTGASPTSPAFSYRSGRGTKFVTYRGFTAKLKSLLSKAGFSPEKFSGHSLRRGGVTFLYACGASILQIQASWWLGIFCMDQIHL